MTLRQLLGASLLYGFADALVVGVGGFLLLPLYTHALGQAEFGMFVVLRANIELLGYLITFGLLTAVARLYFDNRDDPPGFFNAILMVFLTILAVTALGAAIFGDPIWRTLSPAVPVKPYIWWSLLVAAMTFAAALGSLWLRLDNRVGAFVAIQIASSALLALAVYVALRVWHLGLPGLLAALAIGFLPGALVLFVRIGGRIRPKFSRAQVGPAMTYGAPIAVSYLAYFFLNRFSLLTLQRHVPLDEIAVFGLAQQLALIVSVVAASAGKAMQPAVFGAPPDTAHAVLRRASRLFILVIFSAAAIVTVFAPEIVALVAPAGFRGAIGVLLILLIASFVYALSLVSNTALDLHRKPRWSAAVTVVGAALSVVLNLALVPSFGLMGGAVAALAAFTGATALSFTLSWRLTRQSYLGEIGLTTAALVGLAIVAQWPGWGTWSPLGAIGAKLMIVGGSSAVLALLYAPALARAQFMRIRSVLGS